MTQNRSTQTSPCPKALGDETEHFWLVQRMAKAAGVDLAAAMADGHLDQRHWAGMVQRCRGCAWDDGCHRWLDSRLDPEEVAEDAPEGCLNRRLLTTLKAMAAE